MRTEFPQNQVLGFRRVEFPQERGFEEQNSLKRVLRSRTPLGEQVPGVKRSKTPLGAGARGLGEQNSPQERAGIPKSGRMSPFPEGQQFYKGEV